MRSLSAWRSRHAELDRALRSAARVAPERDPTRFCAVWDPFAAALRLHMGHEEALLLPAFDGLADRAAPNQRPAVVQADHALIREHLDAIGRPADDAAAHTARAERLVLLLQVLDHHDRREAAGMLAVLDAHVPAEVRAAWLARIAAEEAAIVFGEVAPRPAPPWSGSTGDPADRLAAAAAHDGDLGVALPALDGANGARVGRGVAEAVARADGAADLVARRDALLDVLDALRRWRAVRGAQRS